MRTEEKTLSPIRPKSPPPSVLSRIAAKLFLEQFLGARYQVV